MAVWRCELCGRVYTQAEIEELCWYDGLRCDEPDADQNEHDDVRCGGVVSLEKAQETT